MDDHQVLVLGAASWNRMVHIEALPQGVSATIFNARETKGAGSTGVGKSMALAALGHKPIFHCALGKDQYAQSIRWACAKSGILMIVDEQEASTPRHLNIMDQKGGRYSIFLSNGATSVQLDKPRLAQAISKADTIFLSLCASSKEALPLLKDVRAEILLDLHDYDGSKVWYDDFIACADIIQLSDVALSDPKPVIDRLLCGRAKQIIITKGQEGAHIITESKLVKIPACPAKIRDSNGAGDAFSIALWHAQRQGLGFDAAGRFAAAAAALAIESDMLFPAAVGDKEVRKRMQNI